MSRMTTKNIIKLVTALILSIFVAFFVLFIGIGAKNKKVVLEGAAYAVAFIVAFSITGAGDWVALLGLGTMVVAAIRSYQLRDLWLPVKDGAPQQVNWGQTQAPPPIVTPSPQAVPPRPSDDLSSDLSWVSSTAKQNKHRLPSEAYVVILEMCQTLDATIDEDKRQPSGDPGFEYELTALVREYLPAVVKGYLSVPPSMVDDRQPNGRTANEELNEQLDLLSGQADALYSSRHSHTSAELSSTGNFLRQRFGHHKRDGFDFGIE